MFIHGSVLLYISVKNGLEKSKLSARYAGRLHKQLACLRIWGFGGAVVGVGGLAEKWSSESKTEDSEERNMGLSRQQTVKQPAALIQTAIKQTKVLNLQRESLKITQTDTGYKFHAWNSGFANVMVNKSNILWLFTNRLAIKLGFMKKLLYVTQ